jgi:alpha-tubulin suppressor-like RCC1 family protein
MNIANLVLKLSSSLANSTISYQTVAAAIKLLEVGAVDYAISLSALPNASAAQGQLYYVDAAGLYWSDGAEWLPLVTTSTARAYGLGNNSVGQLGDGTTTNRSSPVSIVGGFTDWRQVSTAGSASNGFSNDCTTFGVRENGTLWAWGNNNCGRLGDGTTTNRSSPVSVVGGFTDWCQVDAGCTHALAVRTNGTMWGWGCNSYGRTGTGGTSGTKSSPVSVIGGFTDWCQASSGGRHSAGLRTNCTLWMWGHGAGGKLGFNAATNNESPIQPLGGFTDWCQVSAGGDHTVAVRTNCTLWAWGYNGQGQLGDGTAIVKSSPVSVIGDFTDWCQVSAGHTHSAAIRTNGTLWAWGCNGYGRLGDGTTTIRSSPVLVVGGFTDWCQVSMGAGISAAVRTNGTLWMWGAGDVMPTSTQTSSPISAIGGITSWCQVDAGNRVLFALSSRNYC